MKALGLLLVGLGVVCLVVLGWWMPPPTTASPKPWTPDYSRYDFGGPSDKVLHFGTLPLGMTSSITEAIAHDRTFRAQLEAAGWRLQEHPFRNGQDMLPYADGRLDAMVLGDLPALLAATTHDVGLYALSRQGYNTLIARQRITAPQLRGLRVAFPPLTAAQFTVERALASAGLTLADIRISAAQADDLAGQLRSGGADAVAVWEPQASAILSSVPGAQAITRSETFTFLLLDRAFVGRHPDQARALLAALLRASRWIRESVDHTRLSLHWSVEASLKFAGRTSFDESPLSVTLLRRETVDNPSFPLLPLDVKTDTGVLRRQFAFLAGAGVLPAAVPWERVAERIDPALVSDLFLHSRDWGLDDFAYEASP